jgi:hypothetical protein
MDDLEQLSLEAACGNQAAADFLMLVTEALHLWDDLIDRDKKVSDAQVNKVFTNLLCVLPLNPFFRNFSVQLCTVAMLAIQNWHVANKAERTDQNQAVDAATVPLDVAFILRSSYIDLVTMTATFCGGTAHGQQIAGKVHNLAHREGFKNYLLNLEREKFLRTLEPDYVL